MKIDDYDLDRLDSLTVPNAQTALTALNSTAPTALTAFSALPALSALTALAIALPATLPAQARPSLMPWPAQVTWESGRLRVDSGFTAFATGFSDSRLEAGIARAVRRLEGRTGLSLPARPPEGAAPALAVQATGAGQAVQTPEEDESYTLDVTPERARLAAGTVVGALRGLETLLQLVSADSAGYYLPAVRIVDTPRFRWRGLLVDAGRHFMPPEVIRRTLDGMALVKLNVLHWHLSEDQGFRVESRRYPKLHQLGSDGQYYTREEVRQLVAYARDRGIRVVPEFDMPGHSTSWFVGYPEYASAPGPYTIERRFGVFDPAFDPTREETYEFLDGFVADMVELFPDPYWHIGGDEVSGRHWNQNPRILRFKRRQGLADNHALQAHFNQGLARILTRHHRRMVGWDEILHPGLPPGAVIQSWRGTEYVGRAARQGFGTILSAPYYLDHIKPADEHYLADPLPPGHGLTALQQALVLGGEACMWAEHVSPETVDSRLWPRLAAVAERLWSPAAVRDVDDMYRRLAGVSVDLERVGLTHEGHSDRMLRRLTGRRDPGPLAPLLAATMPVTFGDRSRIQRTTQLTPLTRLVDAARPDPWLRSRLNVLAARVVADPAGAARERAELVATFRSWQPLPREVAAFADSVPLARDGIPAAQALAELGALGLAALEQLAPTTDGARWPGRAAAQERVAELGKPQGLLRLAAVEAVLWLIAAAPK